jgi:hypothetical protein
LSLPPFGKQLFGLQYFDILVRKVKLGSQALLFQRERQLTLDSDLRAFYLSFG